MSKHSLVPMLVLFFSCQQLLESISTKGIQE